MFRVMFSKDSISGGQRSDLDLRSRAVFQVHVLANDNDLRQCSSTDLNVAYYIVAHESIVPTITRSFVVILTQLVMCCIFKAGRPRCQVHVWLS